MKFDILIKIVVTLSKIWAVGVTILGFILALRFSDVTIFMYVLPFAMAALGIKQIVDLKKNTIEKEKKLNK